MKTPIEDLCRGLPDAFTKYFKYVQVLGVIYEESHGGER
jgi:hypothetical protein